MGIFTKVVIVYCRLVAPRDGFHASFLNLVCRNGAFAEFDREKKLVAKVCWSLCIFVFVR